jgi:hypothetical protein
MDRASFLGRCVPVKFLRYERDQGRMAHLSERPALWFGKIALKTFARPEEEP